VTVRIRDHYQVRLGADVIPDADGAARCNPSEQTPERLAITAPSQSVIMPRDRGLRGGRQPREAYEYEDKRTTN
jgi:hypothetical protein